MCIVSKRIDGYTCPRNLNSGLLDGTGRQRFPLRSGFDWRIPRSLCSSILLVRFVELGHLQAMEFQVALCDHLLSDDLRLDLDNVLVDLRYLDSNFDFPSRPFAPTRRWQWRR